MRIGTREADTIGIIGKIVEAAINARGNTGVQTNINVEGDFVQNIGGRFDEEFRENVVKILVDRGIITKENPLHSLEELSPEAIKRAEESLEPKSEKI